MPDSWIWKSASLPASPESKLSTRNFFQRCVFNGVSDLLLSFLSSSTSLSVSRSLKTQALNHSFLATTIHSLTFFILLSNIQHITMKFTGIAASLALAGTVSAAAIPVVDTTVQSTLSQLTGVLGKVDNVVGGLVGCASTDLTGLKDGMLPMTVNLC